MPYQSKTISLHNDVWAALDAFRTAQGENGKPASYNKILSKWLNGGGVVQPKAGTMNMVVDRVPDNLRCDEPITIQRETVVRSVAPRKATVERKSKEGRK